MDDASVLAGRRALDEARELSALHQLGDRALGQRQRVDEVRDGRDGAGRARDLLQEQVLARRDPVRARRILAATQKAPELGAERGRDLVVVSHSLIL